jgi:malate dehydrogenase (oxaloacetate-decarboxylating)(NADP+)
MSGSTHPTGYDLLRNPRLTKGTAFTEAQRRAWGLEGLLPPAVTTLALQVARRHAEIAALQDDLQKYLVLSDLQTRNETLYYAVLMSDPATYMPIVYTPTVGEACQKFGHIFRAPRGMYLPVSSRGRLKQLLSNWPERDVRFIVVTDGERILGLGDLGAGGMGIPIGKLSLYTACAGVPPQYCLPIVLDVGTNNQVLLDDPLYQGLRQHRVRGEEYLAFIDEFVAAVEQLYPKCCIQWEDFANFNAVPVLARYRDKICTFNDDIQGTAGVALAGIYGALRITGQKLSEQRFLFLGARLRRNRDRRADQPGDGAGGNGPRRCSAPQCAIRHQRPARDLAHRSCRLSEAFRAGSCASAHICRGGRGAQADRHHRREHRAETVQP